MDTACVTTPFGRRAMSFALLTKHRQAEKTSPDIKRNKWALFRAVCEARNDLEVSDRSLTVLDALLSFYPSDELSSTNSMIVFPSNAQLSIRARGMTAATLRRHLAALVDAGLILRKDSPNGKRYARRNRAGDVSEAFGFNLTPLLSRAPEIEAIAARIAVDRELHQTAREKISLCRREITKLIYLAQESSIPGDWTELHDRFRSILSSLPRRPLLEELQALLAKLTEIRARIINLLEEHDNSQNMCVNESQNERHIQDSQTQSLSESETAREAPRTKTLNTSTTSDRTMNIHISVDEDHCDPRETLKPMVPLGTVLRACAEIHPYGPGGSIRSWRDLLTATAVLRSMLQISPSAFQEACLVMGPENAGVAVACIFERGGHINSAGAYLRNLARRATQRQFTIKPMVLALLKSKALMS